MNIAPTSPSPATNSTTPTILSKTSDAQMELQLETLLQIRAALDATGVLAGWNRAAGQAGGYCDWLGVTCRAATKTVEKLIMWRGTGIDGLQGTLPPATLLRGLPNLSTISITSQAGLTGSLPEDWSTLTLLETIEASNNSLSGTIPSSYGNLSKLSALYAWSSGLSGTLPSSFAHLKALTVLDISTNRFSGTIPAWLGGLTNLRILRLGGNRFKGSIPDSLGNLGSLQELVLFSNGLSGPIPASFGGLSQLKTLNLFNDSVKGTLPSSLSQLSKLEDFRISKNGLSGTVPASYSKMTSLKVFYSWGNPMLQGCLPLSWRDQLNISNFKTGVLSHTQLKGYC
eukprot:GHUV01018528.1.p1 GENE.GHUV01018528.1~~GHUV01018528.1.p1  ORF type:complete len:342 (+),score=28.29 GHUV01018528.1:1360-2385(+)